MNKGELVKAVAEEVNIPVKTAEKVLNAFFEKVTKTLKNKEEIRLAGFGTFKIVERKERKGKNPKTGEMITIPAKKKVKFVPGKNLHL